MTKRTLLDVAALTVAAVVVALNLRVVSDAASGVASGVLKRHYRRTLFAELKPVALANCTLARFGHSHDGGYLMCANLLGNVRSAYSYGIEGRDEWGCAVGRTVGVPVHQYDCFVTMRPECPGATFIFHEECVGDRPTNAEGRAFDTLDRQVARNGDGERHLAVKMDIEGAEWQVLRAAPDDTLARIDQLVIEFHETDQRHFVEVIRRLKRTFVVAHVHFNKAACHDGVRPFPSRAYEVLFVNKRISMIDPGGAAPEPPVIGLDSPNYPNRPDCQAAWH